MLRVNPKSYLIQTGETHFMRITPNQCEGEIKELPENEQIIQKSNLKFVDLFWFYYENKKTKENQLDLVTFTLNLNYGNLRINGYLDVSKAIHNQAFFLTNDLLTINAAIYPSALFHIRNMRNGDRFKPLEQLFVSYDPENEPWQNELAQTEFAKQNDQMWMQITNSKDNYLYLFKGTQYNLFNYALDFILTKGITLVGMNKSNQT